MSLYSKLNFIYWGSQPKCTSSYLKIFDYYGIQYNHSGEMKFQVDDGEIELIDGSYAFISKPNFKILYTSNNMMPRNHNFVTFNGERIKEYLDCDLIDTEKPELIYIFNANKFLEILNELHHELWRDMNSSEAINLTDKLLLILHKEKNIAKDRNLTYFNTLNELFQDISENPLKSWDFEKESKKIGVSLAHFRRLFTQQFSIAPHHFWIKMRLNLANKLLLETDMQVQEIAEKCHFTDVYFFSKQFKSFNGISPLAFRKKNLTIFKNKN